MRITALLLSLCLAFSLAADAVEDVRQAEIAFAKAFADRDKAKFFSFVAPDAVFLSPLGTQRGKEQVVARWSRFFDGVPVAPFEWGPERVEVTSAGTLGFSMGPIYLPNGDHAGYYSSVWQKQADGSWKVVIDGPGNPVPPLPENTLRREEGFVTTPDGAKLHFSKVGNGPVTLIVPFGALLEKPMSQFADIATVISYDMRNRGRSSSVADSATFTIQQDVADLESVRSHLKVEKFVPVGFSYLGKMVVMYAAAHPQRVSRVIQLGPGSNEPLEPSKDVPAADVPAENQARMKALQEGAEASDLERCEAQWGVFQYFLIGNARRVGALQSLCSLENERPANLDRHFAVLMPTVFRTVLSAEELKKVAMPVLTIHGTWDRNAPFAGGRAWATQLPDARLLAVDKAAHAVWADDPVAVFGAIRHFLRGEWPLGSVE